MAERRTHQGATYERSGPGQPWTLVGGGQGAPGPEGVILDDPSRQLRDEYTQSRIDRGRQVIGNDATLTPLQRRQLELQNEALENTEGRAGRTPIQRDALIGRWNGIELFERQLADLERQYRERFANSGGILGMGEDRNITGMIPNRMNSENEQFNAAADSLIGTIANVQGTTGGEMNSLAELRARFGPMVPSSADSDATIQQKIATLRQMAGQQRTELRQLLGPDVPQSRTEPGTGGATPEEEQYAAGLESALNSGQIRTPAELDAYFRAHNRAASGPEHRAALEEFLRAESRDPRSRIGAERYVAPPPDISDVRGGGENAVNPLMLNEAMRNADPMLGPLFRAASGVLGSEGGDAFHRGFIDVPMLGLSDEIAGTISGDMGREREINRYDEENNFGARLGGQVAGGFALPAGRLTTLPRLMGGGAAYGGAYGLGSGEGGVGDRLVSGAQGATVGAATAGVIGAPLFGLARRAATRAAQAEVPSIAQLRQQAGDLYTAAESRGVVAGPNVTADIAGRVRDIARNEELVTPTGRVSEAYPRAAEAMKLLDDYAGVDMNPRQIQVIRETLADAIGGTQGKERRIASMMLSAFDEATVPLAPELAQARDVASRYLRAGKVQRAIDLAEPRAAGYTQSGSGNALRAEFRNLDRRMIRGQDNFDGAVADGPVQDAIERVSRGDWRSNILRNIGRLAPRGPVSAGMSAGVPFLIGNAMGGPAVGAAASAGTMGAGAGAQFLSNRATANQARIAEMLARNGGGIVPAETGATEATREAARRISLALFGPIENQMPDY